jgi:hypothetical protein
MVIAPMLFERPLPAVLSRAWAERGCGRHLGAGFPGWRRVAESPVWRDRRTGVLERDLLVPPTRRGPRAARPRGRAHGRGLLPGWMIRKDRPLVVRHGVPMHAPDGPLQSFEEGGDGPGLLRREPGQPDRHARSPPRGPRGEGRVGGRGRTCHGFSRSAHRLQAGAMVDVGGVGREGGACVREDSRAAALFTVCLVVSSV